MLKNAVRVHVCAGGFYGDSYLQKASLGRGEESAGRETGIDLIICSVDQELPLISIFRQAHPNLYR